MTRAKRRTIVRWSDDLDQLLLLTIHYVCSAKNVKIPWAEVAQVMGHNTSEGAIVQHLDKARKKRAAEGKAVPPPRKRGSAGGGGGASRTIHAPIAQGRKAQMPAPESCGSSDEEWVENGGLQRKRPRRKARAIYAEPPKPESEDSEDSDSEMLVPNADFLQLPNDRNQPKGQRSPSPKQSLVVALKCPKWLSGHTQDAPFTSPVSTSFDETVTPTNSTFSHPDSDLEHDPYIDCGNGAGPENKIAPSEYPGYDLPPIEPFDPYEQFTVDASSYLFPENFQLEGEYSGLPGDGMDFAGNILDSGYWHEGEMMGQYQY